MTKALLLTKKQLKVYDFINSHIDKERVPPTVREIAAHYKSVHSNVWRILRSLECSGYIKIHPAKPRGIEVLK